MATWAIGDVQGCMRELQALLEAIGFERACDELWFVGDLVNRGPDSLAVLRFVRDLGERARVVLGNHDLHLVALAAGGARARADDTLAAVLAAPAADELLAWLRTRRMLVFERGWLMVHAGLLPAWDAASAVRLAAEVEAALGAANHRDFLANLYGSRPDRWSESLMGWDRLRVIVNAMTRMRFCSREGVMEFHTKGEASGAPPGYLPWFDVPGRHSAGTRLVCGHWSALGLHLAGDVHAIDSGCVWGGALSALRLEDSALVQVPCVGAALPIQSQ